MSISRSEAETFSSHPVIWARFIARLEEVAGASVELVLRDEAPPGLAFRIFQEGRVLFDRDPSAFLERKAKAMLEYYDWQPIEARLARAVLEPAQRGR